MTQPESLANQLDRLASRIVCGDVVFFVGAGYSIDSERNTAGIFVARLVARFEAITDSVAASETDKETPLGRLCASLKAGLRRTFSLDVKDGSDTGDIWHETKKNINLLAENYYQINDWMCSAYDSLLVYADALERLRRDVHRRENELLRRFHAIDPVGHKLPLPPTQFARYGALFQETRDSSVERAAAGKALFLETMGFEDRAVMAGNFLSTPEYMTSAYVGRLRPRHFVLAWMAHEGWLPVVVTTNYDLLLEGAFRLAGMEPQVADENLRDPLEPRAPPIPERWNSRLRNFTPISDATQFFSYGDGYESALLLKIHGCAYRYRYESRNAKGWRDVLPTMVFTFREIQNWRDDSWSRDYLKTLMRTRTVAFAGYSTADPVLHDTFRSVYEEMAGYRARRYRQQRSLQPVERSVPADHTGNAFYYSVAQKREFHALEVLRAASLAVGAKSADLTSHPNLIGFHFESGPEFPKLDEAMLWTYHLAYRKQQRQALERELCRVHYQLFGKPCPDSEANAIVAAFRDVVANEMTRACALEDEFKRAQHANDPKLKDVVAARRVELQRSVGWTAHFHRNLMREYEGADLLVREPSRASRVHASMRWPWYAPLSDHPDWGAWAVVLELALRCRSAVWVGARHDWKGAATWIEPIPADRPAVLVPNPRDGAIPAAPRMAICIEVPELRIMTRAGEPARALHLLPRVGLSLRGHAVPWRRQRDPRNRRVDLKAPSPHRIWRWALGHGGRTSAHFQCAHVFFGGIDVRPFGRHASRHR